jgi:hypothetical protein
MWLSWLICFDVERQQQTTQIGPILIWSNRPHSSYNVSQSGQICTTSTYGSEQLTRSRWWAPRSSTTMFLPTTRKAYCPRTWCTSTMWGNDNAKRDKFERDERLLRRELEMEPENVRTVFYLANVQRSSPSMSGAWPWAGGSPRSITASLCSAPVLWRPLRAQLVVPSPCTILLCTSTATADTSLHGTVRRPCIVYPTPPMSHKHTLLPPTFTIPGWRTSRRACAGTSSFFRTNGHSARRRRQRS